MKRILDFLKHTRPFSRVLFFLWCASVYMGGASAIPFFSALLLLPAFLIENACNPVFKKNTKKKNGSRGRQRVSDERKENTRKNGIDVVVDGAEEKKQPIPRKDPLLERFFRDMEKYEATEGAVAKPVPLQRYQPTYDTLSGSQKNWYFYWRSQVRKGTFPDTPQAYIYLHVYELLSGFGWKTPLEGYDRLTNLWMHYRKAYPELDRYMIPWLFDFSHVYGAEYLVPEKTVLGLPRQEALQNTVLHSHLEDSPLKLPFELVRLLCDYPVTESKFYREGRESLVKEAVPRVVALADAVLIKRTGKGVLETYGPKHRQIGTHTVFEGALCPRAGERIQITFKSYTSSRSLRGYMTQLVRFTENVLRELYGVKGRLRGVCVEEETAFLIKAFLLREYSPEKKKSEPKEARRAELNFEDIRRLRDESDAVREALSVDGPEEDPPEESASVPADLQEPQRGEKTEEGSCPFDSDALPDELSCFTRALSVAQCKIVTVLLKGDNKTERIEALAEEEGSMAELLLDEINEIASETVGDLIIDTMAEEARVFAPYADQLIQAMKQEETICQ